MRSKRIGALVLFLFLTPSLPWAVPCVLPDNGSGTIDLPPECPDGYVGPMVIQDGLPEGTTIEIDGRLTDFQNFYRFEGGNLDGEGQSCDATLEMYMTGTGTLAGWTRFLALPVVVEFHTAPRTPGDPIQQFDALIFALYGELVGDSDFDLLEVLAGTHFGLPSPGQTTLTELPSGDFAVDSFFDITYRIDFQGASPSPLEGLSGSSTDTQRFQAGGSSDPTSTEEGGPVATFDLRASPNPFNPATTIEYAIPVSGAPLSLVVFDLRGRLVRSLLDETTSAVGRGAVVWDGTDDRGAELPSGVYFTILRTGQVRLAGKITLIR